MAYVTKSSRPFVYGTFHFKALPGLKRTVPAPPGPRPPFALEILREFSANELIGKLYQDVNGAWVPMQPQWLSSFDWGAMYEKSRGKIKIVFDMAAAGVWDVEHFREESDETGLYVAAALRHAG